MTKELLQKLTLYSILPCILAIAAVFLNNLFQPQLHWQLKLLEHKDETFSRIDGLDNNTTTLFTEPFVRAYLNNEDEGCQTTVYYGKMVYIQNKSLQDKLLLEKWVQINRTFTGILLFLMIIQAGGDAYLLLIYKRVKQSTAAMLIVLVGIAIMILISMLGPNHVIGVFCSLPQEVKVEATLTSMSLDGLFYFLLGGIANILALILMIKHYLPKPIFEQTTESTS